MGRNFITQDKISQYGSPRVEISLFGDWDKTIRIIQKLGPSIKQASIKAQLKVCKEIQKVVKAHLRNQDLGWKQLSPEYEAKKEQKGLDHRILMAWGTYYDSIEVWRKGNQHMVFVGVKKGIYTRDLQGRKSRLDVATIAAIHEFSSGKKIPRRALWNPSIREIGGIKGIQKMYLGSLTYWLRMAGVPVKQFQRLF